MIVELQEKGHKTWTRKAVVDVKRSGQAPRAEGVIRSPQQMCGKELVYFMKVTSLATPVLVWEFPLSHVRTPDRVRNKTISPYFPH